MEESKVINKSWMDEGIFLKRIFERTEGKKNMDGTKRANIKQGIKVKVVQKQDQRSGKLTEGVVSRILTNSATHPHGIKVKLESGVVGRVKEIIE